MEYEILLDHGETANKCTIAPLKNRPDFRIVPVFGEGPWGPFSAPILLHHDGRCLSQLRTEISASKIASVDCTWRRLPRLLERMLWVDEKKPVLAKIPSGFVTTYPRLTWKKNDPDGGLATIEALFVAAALLGHYDPTLFSKYFFGRKFIEVNAMRFGELGVTEIQDPHRLPVLAFERNARSRQKNRAR